MAKILRTYRIAAAKRQIDRCYYCNVPMWEQAPPRPLLNFAKSAKRADQLRCTAEHLTARAEGGSNAASNIVAACAFCNRTRHRAKRPLGPHEYRQYVCSRMAEGRWHPKWVHDFANNVVKNADRES